MEAELRRLSDMVARLSERQSALETTFGVIKDDGAPGPRVKLFVKEEIAPLKDSVGRIEVAVTKLADAQTREIQEREEFYASYKATLNLDQRRKEDAEREKQLVPTLKRWGAIAGAVGAVWFLFRIAGTLLEVWISARTNK